MRALLDTNVLIYDTYEDSTRHSKASSILDELDEWVISLIVVYEYAWFLKGIGGTLKRCWRSLRTTRSPISPLWEGE